MQNFNAATTSDFPKKTNEETQVVKRSFLFDQIRGNMCDNGAKWDWTAYSQQLLLGQPDRRFMLCPVGEQVHVLHSVRIRSRSLDQIETPGQLL